MPHKGAEEEHPQNHLIILISLFSFVIVMILDLTWFKLTDFLVEYVAFWMRFLLFIIFFGFGIFLLRESDKIVFDDEKSKNVVREGVYGIIRHPMYAGMYFIFLGFIFLTLSLISLLPCIISFIIMDKISTRYEEGKLIKKYGKDYIKYRREVGKWFPKNEEKKFNKKILN